MAENFGEMSYGNMMDSTRTVRTNWIKRFLIAPHNVGYHLEHHLYQGVPFYYLPKLDELLMKQEEFKDFAHISNGYLEGLLDELASARIAA